MREKQAKTYFLVGNNFLRKREFLAAANSYKTAIELDHNYYKAYSNLGVAYKNLGMYNEAEMILRRGIELKPYSAVLHNNLGNVMVSVQRLAEAEQQYKRALQIYPKYREAIFNLSQVYYFTGRVEQAIGLRLRIAPKTK